MLPRLSWYQVNYQPNINKNGIRKYLAYSITLEPDAQASGDGKRRKRRDIEAGNGTVFDPASSNFEFEIGSQSECPDPRNKNVPCNGPVQKGKKFR